MAKRIKGKAIKNFDDWINATGAIAKNSSWYFELKHIVEMACDRPGDLEKCVWKVNLNYWSTSCGFEISDDDTSFSWKFCPWCGKELS
jgi:hypothetical protein